MKNNKLKPTEKTALVYTLAATSTAAIAYATPKIIENKLSIREYHHLIVAGIIYEYIKYRRAKTSKL